MGALFYLVISCLAAVSYGSPTPRIVGGESAKIGEFPYMVSLRSLKTHWCGGSILSQRYILTAAHCLLRFVENPNQKLTVHVGTNFRNETGDMYEVEKIIMHPEYNETYTLNDIGLLRLTKDIQFKSTVKTIVPATNVAQGGDPCTLCGWGDLRFWGKKPNDLQKLSLRVFPFTECKRIWKQWRILPDSQICGFARDGQGACHGDSGSPLVSKGVQIGITSYARPCAIGIPDVYTRVSFYKEWINKNANL